MDLKQRLPNRMPAMHYLPSLMLAFWFLLISVVFDPVGRSSTVIQMMVTIVAIAGDVAIMGFSLILAYRLTRSVLPPNPNPYVLHCRAIATFIAVTLVNHFLAGVMCGILAALL